MYAGTRNIIHKITAKIFRYKKYQNLQLRTLDKRLKFILVLKIAVRDNIDFFKHLLINHDLVLV